MDWCDRGEIRTGLYKVRGPHSQAMPIANAALTSPPWAARARHPCSPPGTPLASSGSLTTPVHSARVRALEAIVMLGPLLVSPLPLMIAFLSLLADRIDPLSSGTLPPLRTQMTVQQLQQTLRTLRS